MVDDENLDSLLSGNVDGLNPVSNNAEQKIRPKLKKIKRPKIRPSSEQPIAPAKIFPDVDKENIINETESLSVPSVDNSNEEENSKISTDLVTAREAQNMVTKNLSESNPYVIEGLPPELDFNETDEDFEDNFEEDDDFIEAKRNQKKLIFISLACLLIGLFIGATLFSKKTEEKHGLEGVVLNSDIPAGRPRCGLTDQSQACVFYVMNCYKQELTGRDFYALAATLTGREAFMVETENLRYANVKIKPGQFAQLSIPALK